MNKSLSARSAAQRRDRGEMLGDLAVVPGITLVATRLGCASWTSDVLLCLCARFLSPTNFATAFCAHFFPCPSPLSHSGRPQRPRRPNASIPARIIGVSSCKRGISRAQSQISELMGNAAAVVDGVERRSRGSASHSYQLSNCVSARSISGPNRSRYHTTNSKSGGSGALSRAQAAHMVRNSLTMTMLPTSALKPTKR